MIGVRQALHAVLKQKGYDPVAVDPWFFPSPGHYRQLLKEVGFKVESCGELETFSSPGFCTTPPLTSLSFCVRSRT